MIKNRVSKEGTQKRYEQIAALWDTHTTSEIAKKLSILPVTVSTIAVRMRKNGVPLSRKAKETRGVNFSKVKKLYLSTKGRKYAVNATGNGPKEFDYIFGQPLALSDTRSTAGG